MHLENVCPPPSPSPPDPPSLTPTRPPFEPLHAAWKDVGKNERRTRVDYVLKKYNEFWKGSALDIETGLIKRVFGRTGRPPQNTPKVRDLALQKIKSQLLDKQRPDREADVRSAIIEVSAEEGRFVSPSPRMVKAVLEEMEHLGRELKVRARVASKNAAPSLAS